MEEESQELSTTSLGEVEVEVSVTPKRSWHQVHKTYLARVLLLFVVSYIVIFAAMALSLPAHGLLNGLLENLNFIIPIFWPFQALVNLFLPLAQWGNSPMFYLLPIPGFFLMYYLIDWMEERFKFSETEKKYFPFVFWLLAILAYFVVLLWYFHNMYQLSLSANPALVEQEVSFWTYMFGGTLKDGAYWVGSQFNFWHYLKDSPYLVFVLAAFLGWVSRKFVIGVVDRKFPRK